MKKSLSTTLLAILMCVCMVFGFAGCANQEDIDNSVNTAIAPISEQITAINTSIDDLKAVDTTLDGYIDALETKVTELEASDTATTEEITAIKSVIETLKTKDTELDGKITTLENYVNTELSATEDWAEATFATLAQYAEIQTDITGIKATLTTLVDTTALSTAISTSENGMKEWVNKALADGYYTISQIDTKLSELKTELNGKDEELNAAINEQKTALENAKTDLTTAYNNAISTAINDNNGTINTKIANAIAAAKTELQGKIDTINGEITQIKAEISTLNSTVAALQEKITELEIRINCLEGKHVIDETQETSLIYTWSETAPITTRKYVCVHCKNTIEENYSTNNWVVGDKVTYVAKDGNAYVSTVSKKTDTTAIIVRDDVVSLKGIYTQEELFARIENTGARVPMLDEIDEEKENDILKSLLETTLVYSDSTSHYAPTSTIFGSGFAYKGSDGNFWQTTNPNTNDSTNWHLIYVWDVPLTA